MKNIKLVLKRYKVPIVILFVYLIVCIINPGFFQEIKKIKLSNYITSLLLLPAIIIIVSLMDGWINKNAMVRFLGDKSGIKGHIIAFVFGCLGVGPIYVAFPIVSMIYKKGASYYNCLIIMGAWSVGRIQQLVYEIPNMGLRFTIIRFLFNFIFILLFCKTIDMTTDTKDKNVFDITKLE